MIWKRSIFSPRRTQSTQRTALNIVIRNFTTKVTKDTRKWKSFVSLVHLVVKNNSQFSVRSVPSVVKKMVKS